MTINHLFLKVSSSRMPMLKAFYKSIFRPLGYTEMIRAHDGLVGYGSDYPYFWLKALPEDQSPVPTHVAFDAPGISISPRTWHENKLTLEKDQESVDEFYRLALKEGGTDNGGPGIRVEMSRQPYYSAFIIDPDGNNIEAVCLKR